jgi:serine/threonine-protein kinase
MNAETLVGRTFGRYLIGDILGRGTMGVVYAGRDVAASRDVALKVICPDDAFGTDEIQRFQHEALWLSRCDDPHVVRVYGTGCVDGVDYIAMERMQSTLQARIAWPRPDMRELVEIGAGILLGLAAAHREGIIHQDVKPANVGIARDGTIKLLDFGVACPLPFSRHLQDAGTVAAQLACVGSLHYMSPEQLRGDAVDERADVYGTGAVLYELATGRRPFPELRPACLIDAVLNEDPSLASLANPDLPVALDALIARALAKEPCDRFPTVLAMMDALLRIDAPRWSARGPWLMASRRATRASVPARTRPRQKAAAQGRSAAVSLAAFQPRADYSSAEPRRDRTPAGCVGSRVHRRITDACAEG